MHGLFHILEYNELTVLSVDSIFSVSEHFYGKYAVGLARPNSFPFRFKFKYMHNFEYSGQSFYN